MTALPLDLLLLQVVVPVGLLAWLALGRPRSRAAWTARVMLAAAYVVAVALAGLWLALPVHLPVAYLALLPVALVASRRRLRARRAWPAGPGAWTRLAIQVVLAATSLGLGVRAVAGRRPPPGPAVELSFPLRDGRPGWGAAPGDRADPEPQRGRGEHHLDRQARPRPDRKSVV